MTALYDDSRALILVLLLIIVAGLSSLFTIPMAEDPRITNRVATVLTPYPGASAVRVERLISQPLEDELRKLPEVKEVSSTSSVGLSSVTIVLEDVIVDSESVFSEARDAVADVATSLPSGALPPEFIDERGYAFTVLAAIRWTASSEPNPLILKRMAEELESRLIGVPGTDYTEIKGVGPEEISVTLNADTAQSLGIDEAQIAAILGASDAKGAAGEILSDRQRSAVEVRGEFTDLDRIRDVIVSVSNDGAAQLKLGDIASVSRGVRTPEEAFALIEGQRAVIVGTRMQDGLRVSAFAQRVRDELEAFQSDLSAGTELQIIFDQSVYSEERFASLAGNLMIGVGLVVLILLVTLGLRAAIIVGTVIPLTALAALAVMNLTGVKLHQMSVTGLIVALGLLVDAAIVICDAVGRRLRSGLSAREAVKASVERLWLPLLSSTITTVLAFLPITLLPGGAGEFVGPIADSVIIALLVSLALALTVTAALAGIFLKAGAEKITLLGRITAPIGKGFRQTLALSLRYPLLSIGVALILPIWGFVSVTKLPTQFFPAADRQQFHVQIEMEQQAGIGRTQEAVAIADALIEGTEGLQSAHWFIGNSVMPFYYNIVPSRDRALNFAEAMVTADKLDGLYPLQDDLQDRLERAIPDARVLVRTIVQGPPTAAPVELRLSGPDLAELQRLGETARALFADMPEIVTTTASISGGVPKVWINADESALRTTGLTLNDVSQAIGAKLQGRSAGTVIEADTEIPVTVRLDDAARQSFAALRGAAITLPPNATSERAFDEISLSALGDLNVEPSAPRITRFQGERINQILGYVRTDALPSTAVEKFEVAVAEGRFVLPRGYDYSFGGDAEARSDAIGNLLAQVGIIIVATIGVLVLTFRSFRLGAIVLVVAALSMGLGMLALATFGYPFGFQPIIALIGLTGVAINAAIIIMSGLQSEPDAVAGNAEAVCEGVMETSRHITSTTLTTFAGFLPLILSEGDFWPGFATTVAGGVLLSTVISFFFVPQIFLILTRLRPFRARKREEFSQKSPASQADLKTDLAGVPA